MSKSSRPIETWRATIEPVALSRPAGNTGELRQSVSLNAPTAKVDSELIQAIESLPINKQVEWVQSKIVQKLKCTVVGTPRRAVEGMRTSPIFVQIGVNDPTITMRVSRRWIEISELVRPIENLPALKANIFADWLEEHSFNEAADALRHAFPFASNEDTDE